MAKSALPLKDMGKPRDTLSTNPTKNIEVPSVVMKEGIPAFKVIVAFRKPTDKMISSAKKNATIIFNPTRSKSIHIIGVNAKVEPTERSNSPEIIKKLTPIATIPNSDATASIEARLQIDIKLRDIKEKVVKIIIKAIITPSSLSGSML